MRQAVPPGVTRLELVGEARAREPSQALTEASGNNGIDLPPEVICHVVWLLVAGITRATGKVLDTPFTEPRAQPGKTGKGHLQRSTTARGDEALHALLIAQTCLVQPLSLNVVLRNQHVEDG